MILMSDYYTERADFFIKQINREGIEAFINHLGYCGYFTAPCSSQYHGCHEGGLLKHSVIVTGIMLDLREVIAPEIPVESCIIAGMFHDIGKAGYYGKQNYVPNTLKGGKVSDSKPFKSNDDRLNIPHQVASLHIVSKFIPLTEEESFAILFHNGLYTPDGKAIQGNETPLMLLLHFADMWSSRFVEEEYKGCMRRTVLTSSPHGPGASGSPGFLKKGRISWPM
jgi:23S rRNA maturation-related 3'-5' exoribonuclease YhaM